jgi:hypothetical protein
MMLRVIGRVLAVCGWLAWQVQRPIVRGPVRRFGGRRLVAGLAAIVAVLALAPLVVGLAQDQPQDASVDALFDHAVTHPDGWVRLHGRTVSLAVDPTTLADTTTEYGVLVDADETLRAVVIGMSNRVPEAELTTVTGHVVPATVAEPDVQAELPIEATVFAHPPEIVTDAIVMLDASAFPERVVWWPLTLVLGVLAAVLAIGAWAGYPVFRSAREVDVLARPLGPGERIPAAVGGRVGDRRIELADPAEALLLAGRGAHGPVLTIQLMPTGGPAPQPVSIGGGWTAARVGYLHVLGETVPALEVRAEHADATLLFARRSERDRAAAMVATER